MEFQNNCGCFWSTARDLKLCIHRCIPSESVHVWVHRRPQQAAAGFYAGCLSTPQAPASCSRVLRRMFEYTAGLSKLLQGSTQDVWVHRRPQQAAAGFYAGCLSTPQAPASCCRVLRRMFEYTAGPSKLLQGSTQDVWVHRRPQQAAPGFYAGCLSTPQASASCSRVLRRMFEYTAGPSKLLQGSTQDVWVHRRPQQAAAGFYAGCLSTPQASASCSRVLRRMFEFTAGPSKLLQGSTQDVWVHRRPQQAAAGFYAGCLSTPQAPASCCRVLRRMFEYTAGPSKLLQGSTQDVWVHRRPQQAAAGFYAGCLSTPQAPASCSRVLRRMFEYTAGLSKLLQGSTQDVWVHRRPQQAAAGFYAGCLSTPQAPASCCRVLRRMFEYTAGLSKLLQGSTQDVWVHRRPQQAAAGFYAGCLSTPQASASCCRVLRRMFEYTAGPSKLLQGSTQDVWVHRRPQQAAPGFYAGCLSTPQAPASCSRVLRRMFEYTAGPSKLLQGSTQDVWVHRRPQQAAPVFYAGCLSTPQAPASCSRVLRRMFEYTAGPSKLLQGSTQDVWVHRRPQQAAPGFYAGCLSTPQAPASCCRVLRRMFEYTAGPSKLLQGSTQDVLWAYEEVTLGKDIFVGIRQNADAEYSENYKMTESVISTPGAVWDGPRERTWRQTLQRFTGDAKTVLDHLLQELDTRFIAIPGTAVFDLKLLPKNVNELTAANITDPQECYCHHLPSPASMPAEVRLWKKKWDSSDETKPHNLQKTTGATSSSVFLNLFCIVHCWC